MSTKTSTTTTTANGSTSTSTVTCTAPAPAARPAADQPAAVAGVDLLAVADPSSVGMSAERLALIEETIRKAVDVGQLPYGRIKVSRHGQTVYDATVNSALGTQTEESIYRFYSMTKVVTSVAVMIAVERGLICLDDPVEKYIPEYADAKVLEQVDVDSDEKKMVAIESMPTVRQMLTHTAGMAYGGLFGAFGMLDDVDKAYTAAGCGVDMLSTGGLSKWKNLEELAATLAKMPLRHQPGTKFDYAMGHIIAGRCVEVAMGKSLTEVMQQQIFDPLEMTTAGWGVHESETRVLPMYAYGQFDFVDPTRMWKNTFGKPTLHVNEGCRIGDHCKSEADCDKQMCLMPDAQMTGQASDYHKFHTALANGGTAANGYQLLSPTTIGVMMDNNLPEGKTVLDMAAPFAALFAKPFMGYGLGGYSYVANTPHMMSAGAYGWNGAAGTKAMWDRTSGIGFVFYTQQEFCMAPCCDDVFGAITAQIYGAIVKQ